MSMSAATEQLIFDEMMRARKHGKYSPNESNYERLFGTPERAARTIARWCAESDGSCAGCPLFGSGYVRHCLNDYSDIPSLLEWLRGESE